MRSGRAFISFTVLGIGLKKNSRGSYACPRLLSGNYVWQEVYTRVIHEGKEMRGFVC